MMGLLNRFGRGVVRFWPLWLPLILIWAVPLSRPVGRSISDPLVNEVRNWFSEEWSPSNQIVLPDAALHPDDLDLQLWDRWSKSRFVYDNDYQPYGAAAIKFRQRFPNQPLLLAPSLQQEMGLTSLFGHAYNYRAPGSSPAQIALDMKPLRAIAQQGQKLEPDNAFWWVAQAQVEWNVSRYDAALRALERGARCSRYDDYTLELARRLVRACERYGAPTLFDKMDLLRDTRYADENAMINEAEVWTAHARRARTKGKVALALRWSGSMAALGALMQRDPNAPATLLAGAAWQQLAWKVGWPKGTKKSAQGARLFANFARQNGRPDLARATQTQAATARQNDRWLRGRADGNSYNNPLWGAPSQLHLKIQAVRAMAGASAGCLVYLCVWWLMANLLLWRAQGAPSPPRARVSLALAVVLPLSVLALAILWQTRQWDNSTYTPAREVLPMSLTAFAFLSAPFILAAACALLTMKRHRERFSLSPRIDMELALTPWARTFLRWLLPTMVAGSVLIFAFGWALWLLAMWRDWGNVDLLAMLPPDRNGKTNSLFWNPAYEPIPLIYGIFLCCLCLIIWFAKWRWTTPLNLLPLTHGALRWWKESLGAAIVTLAWIFLLIALVSWPLRQQTDARLQRVLKNGELSVVRQISAR